MPRFLVKDTAKHIGEKVRVCGWVNTVRAHGKILFIDLRDISGVLQVVFVRQNSVCDISLIFLVILSQLIIKKLNFFLDKAKDHLYSWPRGVKWFLVEGTGVSFSRPISS